MNTTRYHNSAKLLSYSCLLPFKHATPSSPRRICAARASLIVEMHLLPFGQAVIVALADADETSGRAASGSTAARLFSLSLSLSLSPSLSLSLPLFLSPSDSVWRAKDRQTCLKTRTWAAASMALTRGPAYQRRTVHAVQHVLCILYTVP